ncbi:MAG: histidine kinase [Clostridiales bacterium]|nr:histidine kinase [Candidatus Blautia equi]
MLRSIETWLDNYKLKRKLQIFYLLCVLIPLIITDSLIMYSFSHAEMVQQEYSMKNEAEAVRTTITSTLDFTDSLASSFYINRNLYEFLDEHYRTPYDYFVAYQNLMKSSLFRTTMSGTMLRIKLYGDNETILNGGEFGQTDRIRGETWYQSLQDSGKDSILYVGYESGDVPNYNSKRRVIYLKKMNYYKRDNRERIIKIELDYNGLIRQLEDLYRESDIYICNEDRILFSNNGHSNQTQDFDTFTMQDQIGYELPFTYFGMPMRILIMKEPINAWVFLKEHIPSIIALLLINIFMPWIFSLYMNHSLTRRMSILADAFNSVNEDQLTEISEITGKDEISMLMERYNVMAGRTNELIQSVYKGTIREQEFEISRKNAELLALHSQINPHFMFNTLESIRMHSILRKEYETADMVEKLAIMERQIVNWNEDVIEIQKEMDFVEAYLSLQKYRFGDKLSYEIELDDDCRRIRIPKLSIVTFVENACVHGIESKTNRGWIFVRAYKEDYMLNLEIEDTGGGIDEEEAEQLLYDMEHADIDSVKEKRRGVGVINACLRLKMVMGEDVSFQLTSEKEIGTLVNIRIPLQRRETEET